MKHNEFKAFFKKKLETVLNENFEMIAIDEQTSSRNIYILEKETLKTKFLITSFWGTNDFHIRLFEINDKQRNNKKELNKFEDFCLDVEGNYLQTHLFDKVFTKIKENSLLLK